MKIHITGTTQQSIQPPADIDTKESDATKYVNNFITNLELKSTMSVPNSQCSGQWALLSGYLISLVPLFSPRLENSSPLKSGDNVIPSDLFSTSRWLTLKVRSWVESSHCDVSQVRLTSSPV